MKTGIFGGSFNPVHKGHMHLADTAFEKLGLDRIIFVPSKIPPHKSASEYVSADARYEMCRLAVSEREKYLDSDYEIKSDRISYTYYTINHFKEKYPEDEFYLIVGSDMFLSFETWYRFDDILSMVSLAVASRENGITEELEEKKEFLGKYGRIFLFNVNPLPMSSTKIRKMIKNNEDMYCYLDKKVVKYIVDKNLYRD